MMEKTYMDNHIATHYGADYFNWQKEPGSFGGWANVDKYRDTVKADSTCLDFGCGGGFLLANLACAVRLGIEPNPVARETAKNNGVSVFENPDAALKMLGAESVDIVISDNALEHTLEPLAELRALRRLLKPAGRLHFVVPCENIGWTYKEDDINQHLYSWSPQSFGNLLKAAGYDLEYSRSYIHKWPPGSRALAKLGRPVFNATARIWGQIDRRWYQVEALATKRHQDADETE